MAFWPKMVKFGRSRYKLQVQFAYQGAKMDLWELPFGEKGVSIVKIIIYFYFSTFFKSWDFGVHFWRTWFQEEPKVRDTEKNLVFSCARLV